MSNMDSTKCSQCNKHLTLLDATVGKCKCGGCYCKKHKNSDAHQCTFNYHKDFQETLDKKLKIPMAVKVAQI